MTDTHESDSIPSNDSTLIDSNASFDNFNYDNSFKINSLNLRDFNTGKIFYQSYEDFSKDEKEARVPKKLLKASAIAREISFSSKNEIKDLHVIQQIFLKDSLIEQWNFHFGFVIPGSTNTWQNVIEAAPAGQMIPAKVLSGNMVIQTNFFDGDKCLTESRVRIYYIWVENIALGLPGVLVVQNLFKEININQNRFSNSIFLLKILIILINRFLAKENL